MNYAIREAVDLLDIELDLTGAAETDENKHISAQALQKRMKSISMPSSRYFGVRLLISATAIS